MFTDILYNLTIRPLEILFETVFFIVYRWIGKPFATLFALSLIVNILVFPLYRRADKLQSEQREREKAMESRISHIKKTFKGDEKVMMLQAYYRICDYKPVYALRGVSSLFLQIPFFIAAFRFLSGVSVLGGTPSILLPFVHNPYGPVFLIPDLGAPDGAIHLFGHSINFLPILMTLINIISGTIYSKGHLRKEKIQLYVTALVFLVLLYNSPAGLVIYWTFNNMFSLLKNFVQKLVESIKAKAGVKNTEVKADKEESVRPRVKDTTGKVYDRIFLSCAVLLAVMTGLYIPSNVLSASATEFISTFDVFNPSRYLIYSLALGVGFHVVWVGIYYLFSTGKTRKIFALLSTIVCGAAVINYMLSGSGLGTISADLKYDTPPAFATSLIVKDILLILAVAVVVCILFKFKPAIAGSLALAGCAAVICVSVININGINSAYKKFYDMYNASSDYESMPRISLSRNGQNVVVLLLDRAMGPVVPYLMNERPELMEEFDGFTYYHDTISYGRATNFAMPAVCGGYEYTPYALNQRDDMLLVDKNDEALKVLPVLFYENGFGVTVMDPPLAGYSMVPDLSIYDDYPEINTYISKDKFLENPDVMGEKTVKELKRNFFYFGEMKTWPLFLQDILYEGGNYNQEYMKSHSVNQISLEDFSGNSDQQSEGTLLADGISSSFMSWYTVLDNMSEMTEITDNNNGEFLMMYNCTAHEPTLLQLPDYVPQEHVDNTAYYTGDYYFLLGQALNLSDSAKVTHYHINMATFIKLGEWFDYLREEGVYDNTRIILVADHGIGINWLDGKKFGSRDESVEWYLPLLMVKDFNAHGFESSLDFMTNADACPMAVEGVIENPVNPFTGNPLDGHEKDEDHRVFISGIWDIEYNNGTTFIEDDWYEVNGSPYEMDNWTYLATE